MKIFIAFLAMACTMAVVGARPNEHAEIIKSNSEVEHDHYNFDVETSDGKIHHEDGILKDVGSEHPVIVVRGSYSWKATDGQIYTVNYVADEHGYRPEGVHLPPLPKPVLD